MRFVIIEFVCKVLNINIFTELSVLFYFYAWASKLIHFPSDVIYLFILLAYYSLFPYDSVLETL